MSADPLSLDTLDFGRVLTDVQKGLVVKPIIMSYLDRGLFPDFDVRFRKEEQDRVPDGWFHPSEHPLWNPRALYHYLRVSADPTLAWHPERLQWMNRLSVTMGRAMHGFIEMCLLDANYLVRPGECPTCRRVCGEWGVIDPPTRSRGHTDGRSESESFEFKTSSNQKLMRLDDMDVETFRAKWPDYYAQQQEYMRMSGLRSTRVLFMGLGFPWAMREFKLDYDPVAALRVRDKYLSVIAAVEQGRPPSECCGGGASAKECPSRGLCGVGR